MALISPAPLTFERFMELTRDCRPYPELVEGEIVDQSMPHRLHGYIQMRIGHYAIVAGLYPSAEVHSRVGSNVRLPDVSISADPPTATYPASPPLITVEIVSPDNRHSELLRKCREYAAWGAPHIWLIDPDERQLSIFRDDSFIAVDALELPGYPLRITLTDLLPPESPAPPPPQE